MALPTSERETNSLGDPITPFTYDPETAALPLDVLKNLHRTNQAALRQAGGFSKLNPEQQADFIRVAHAFTHALMTAENLTLPQAVIRRAELMDAKD